MALENPTPVTRPESILNGDDITPVTRKEYFLQKAASEGGGLPEYTSADKGKVLTVGEGEPEWEAASGFFIVNIGGTPQAPTADKTYSEITAAVNAGKIPIAVAAGGSMILSYTGRTGTEYAFTLCNAAIRESSIESISSYVVTIADDNTIVMGFGTRTFS